MADIEITYNNNTIVTMSSSGTEILETNGTYLTDDIEITYTTSPFYDGTVEGDVTTDILIDGGTWDT